MRPIEDWMQNSDFRTFSYNIYMKGDIENPDDLAKMIERNREKTQVDLVSA